MKIMSIAGARPNFMKLASIARAADSFNLEADKSGHDNPSRIHHVIVHTGQHYDEKMSKTFFDELEIPKPDINLEVGSGSHAAQTAEIMKRFEQVLIKELPDVLLVVGDVNSTIACTLVAAKIEYPAEHNRKRPVIVHVEAGLRSFDRGMPEEINRILTDSLSDLLFVTEQSGAQNLHKEGSAGNKVHLVGNVMIDTLIDHLEKAKNSRVKELLSINGPYGLVTLHRPSNVDKLQDLEPIIRALHSISHDIPLYFPVHPRTLKKIGQFDLKDYFNWQFMPENPFGASTVETNSSFYLAPPLGYLDFLNLTAGAALVITDSGGIQEETTFLGVPCVTLRENTERPVTVTEGTNYLTGTDPRNILATIRSILAGDKKNSSIPPFWDGKAGARIIEIILATAQ
jgi:UDP-N-acetylglucosamine 2-epimerase (non-hydrolysing)